MGVMLCLAQGAGFRFGGTGQSKRSMDRMGLCDAFMPHYVGTEARGSVSGSPPSSEEGSEERFFMVTPLRVAAGELLQHYGFVAADNPIDGYRLTGVLDVIRDGVGNGQPPYMSLCGGGLGRGIEAIIAVGGRAPAKASIRKNHLRHNSVRNIRL